MRRSQLGTERAELPLRALACIGVILTILCSRCDSFVCTRPLSLGRSPGLHADSVRPDWASTRRSRSRTSASTTTSSTTPTDPKRDFTMTVTPRAPGAAAGRQDAAGRGRVATGLVYFKKFDDERSIDYAARGRVDARSRLVSALCPGIAARHPGAAQRRAGCARAADRDDLAVGARPSFSPKTGIRVRCSHDRAGVRRRHVLRWGAVSRTLNSGARTSRAAWSST